MTDWSPIHAGTEDDTPKAYINLVYIYSTYIVFHV